MDPNVQRLLKEYYAACLQVVNGSAGVQAEFKALSRAAGKAISASSDVRRIWKKLAECGITQIEFGLNVPFEIDRESEVVPHEQAKQSAEGLRIEITKGDPIEAHGFGVNLQNGDAEEIRRDLVLAHEALGEDSAAAGDAAPGDDTVEATKRLLASIRALAENMTDTRKRLSMPRILRDDSQFGQLGIKFPGGKFLNSDKGWTSWIEHVIELALKQPESATLLKKFEGFLAKLSSADSM